MKTPSFVKFLLRTIENYPSKSQGGLKGRSEINFFQKRSWNKFKYNRYVFIYKKLKFQMRRLYARVCCKWVNHKIIVDLISLLTKFPGDSVQMTAGETQRVLYASWLIYVVANFPWVCVLSERAQRSNRKSFFFLASLKNIAFNRKLPWTSAKLHQNCDARAKLLIDSLELLLFLFVWKADHVSTHS